MLQMSAQCNVSMIVLLPSTIGHIFSISKCDRAFLHPLCHVGLLAQLNQGVQLVLMRPYVLRYV